MATLFDIPAKGDGIHRDARFTKRGDRRFLLTRRWNMEPTQSALFVMLNPSTANAEKDDPTIRKCIGFAKRWGYGALTVVNLFDYITASPKELKAWVERTGEPRNLQLYLDIIRHESYGAAVTVCGWGTWGAWFPERARAVYDVLTSPKALRLTSEGHPGHPLYLPSDLQPFPFTLPSTQSTMSTR